MLQKKFALFSLRHCDKILKKKILDLILAYYKYYKSHTVNNNHASNSKQNQH